MASGVQGGLRPWERGFDYFFGFLGGARNYYSDNPREQDLLLCNARPVTNEKEYLTDAFAREAADFIERSQHQPFFLYLAFNAVHSPLEATEAYQARFPHITDPKRKIYAGMLAAMDDAVGRVLKKLREHGLEESTLIFFYSDNGGPTPETTSRNDPLRGYKGQMFEGGIRVPFLMQWKGTIPAGQTYSEMVMGFDCHAAALAAAGVESTGNEPLDGVNLLPFVTGQVHGRPHEQLSWRAGQQHAVRVGDWKLVTIPQLGGSMLFNLRDDIAEQHNLAASHPEKLEELPLAFAEWEKGTQPAQWIRQDQRNAEIGGKLKPESERAARRPAASRNRIDEAFKSVDKDNDGKLLRDEAPNPESFTAVDANNDGVLTPEELTAFYARRCPGPARQHRMDLQRHGGGGLTMKTTTEPGITSVAFSTATPSLNDVARRTAAERLVAPRADANISFALAGEGLLGHLEFSVGVQ